MAEPRTFTPDAAVPQAPAGGQDAWQAVPDEPAAPAGNLVHGIPYQEGQTPPPGLVQFEHACCKAVRPNPEDPDTVAGMPEPKKEPYLTWEGPVKPTAAIGPWLAIIGILAIAAVPFYFATFAGSQVVMLVLMGLAAIVAFYLLLSFMATSAALRKLEVAAVRHILDPKVERGKVFQAALDTRGIRVPPSLRVWVSDQVAPGIRPVTEPKVLGEGRVEYKVRAQARGLLTFAGLDVRCESRNGLWVQEREYRMRTTVEVEPSLAGITWQGLVSAAVPFDQSHPSCIQKLYRDFEYEVTRPFGDGDRIKDVDWKRMAISGQMVVRKRWGEPDTTLLLVFDCGQTMLMDQAGYRNLDLAVEIAQEMAEGALRRNQETGLLAFNENQIVDHVRPTRAKVQAGRIRDHLAQVVANHHLPGDGEELVKVLIAGDPENLQVGIQQGIRQRSTAALTVVFFSDLQTTPDIVAQNLAKTAANGQRVAVMLMPSPALRPLRSDGTSPLDELEMRGVEQTNRMRELLIANGCEFMEIHPQDHDMSLEKPVDDDPVARRKAERAAARKAAAGGKPGAPGGSGAKPAAPGAKPGAPGAAKPATPAIGGSKQPPKAA